MARMLTYVTAILALTSLILVIGSKPALNLLTAPAYHGAAPLVPIVTAAYFLRCLGDFFRCLFVVEGKPGYDAVCNWIGACVCIAAYMLLIPPYGMWGAALATLLTFGATFAISVVWTFRMTHFSVEGARIGKIALAMLASLLAYAAIPLPSLLLQIAGGSAFIALFPLLLWMFGFATKGERETATYAARSLAGRCYRAVRA
jgi:O-antigen/teichoic acid export membrane protein